MNFSLLPVARSATASPPPGLTSKGGNRGDNRGSKCSKTKKKEPKRWGFVILSRARFWRVNFSNSFLLYKKI